MTWILLTAGRGPAECQRFCYLLWDEIRRDAGRSEVACELLEATSGEEKHSWQSALIAVSGDPTDLFIESWEGTVKWMCKSPFRPNHGRKNWFVKVKAFAEPVHAEWDLSQIRVDTFRSSGPGGQHANKTSSAIRVTHLPTETVVVAQEERSQHRNRALALARLSDVLQAGETRAEQDAQKDRWLECTQIERGNEIRVYTGEKLKRKG